MEEVFYISPHTGNEYVIIPSVSWYNGFDREGKAYKRFITEYRFKDRQTGKPVNSWVHSLEPRVLEAFFGEEEGFYSRPESSRFD